MAAAKKAWADVARNELMVVASQYNGPISYGDLAERVQSITGIRTRMLMHYWIGEVLGTVAGDCHLRGEPLLSALCVHGDGTIGDGYKWAIEQTYGGDPPDDLDMHAAVERLECYRFFGAEVPEDGGQPMLTPQVAARRRNLARRSRASWSRNVCPNCNLELPATGQCDICS